VGSDAPLIWSDLVREEIVRRRGRAALQRRGSCAIGIGLQPLVIRAAATEHGG